MCRWFAYVSPTEHCLLEDVLVNPPHSLSKQVHDHYLPQLFSHNKTERTTEAEVTARNRNFNVDGFGMAWYTAAGHFFNGLDGKRPAMYKSGQPPTNDANFHNICANTATTACFAHVRAATASAVTPTNCHPLIYGRHTIMHNGVISDFLDIKRDMLDAIEKGAYENIHGATDSEHLAALYVTFLIQNSSVKGRASWELQYPVAEMARALISAVKVIITLQQHTLGIEKAQANSLNVCVTDGDQMVAFRFRNHQTEQPPSLYWSHTAGGTLNRKYPDRADGSLNPQAYKRAEEHGKHVIVASEPTTYKKESWKLIPKNQLLLVDRDGNARLEAIDIPLELMAQGKTTGPG